LLESANVINLRGHQKTYLCHRASVTA